MVSNMQIDRTYEIQRQIAQKMRDLDRSIDVYAKLLVDLELLEIEARQTKNQRDPS